MNRDAYETDAGVIATRFYDDGIAKGIEVYVGNELVCMVDVLSRRFGEEDGEIRVLTYKRGKEEPVSWVSANR